MLRKPKKLYGVDVEGINDLLGSNDEEECNMEDELKNIENNVEEEEVEIPSSRKGKKGTAIKVTAGALAGAIAVGSALYVSRNNFRARFGDPSELTDYIQDDNANYNGDVPRNIAYETQDKLLQMNNYIELSKTLDKLYDKYKNRIRNLSLGEMIVSENSIVPLSDEEYQNLLVDLEYIASSNEDTEGDKYMQTVKRVVSYSSAVNGYILYQSSKDLSNLISDNFQNDVAYVYNVAYDDMKPYYDYQNNIIYFERCSTEEDLASYNVPTGGLRVDELIKACSELDANVGVVDNFLLSDEKQLLQDDVCIASKNENGNLVVYYNKDLIKNMEKYINLVKLQLCSVGEVKNGEFGYKFFIPDPENNKEELNSTMNSGYTLTRKL